MTDTRKLHIFSASVLVALLLALVVPVGLSGRILSAILLLPAAVIAFIYLKKRSIFSINSKQVLIILITIALVWAMIYYLTGVHFGFYKNPYTLSFSNFLRFVLPIAVTIVASEIIRTITIAGEDKASYVLCYFSCLVAELLICSTLTRAITSFSNFMDLVGATLFPAVLSNLLYHYLSPRYGMLPTMAFRLITTLHGYIIPVKSAISESLIAFFNLLLPIAIYLFIDALYEKKRRYALGKKSKFAIPITVLAVAIMLSVIMLISNQFRFGTLVIATESMTGELNKGDAAIFERYDGQIITNGQVIVFEKNDSMIVHRVADIQKINGTTQYYTKGDANDTLDAGFITDANIVGLVNLKIPYIGYPTLWVRSLFNH